MTGRSLNLGRYIRKLFVAALLLAPVFAYAGTTTLTGTIKDSFGTGINGTLLMYLPVPAQDPSTGTAISPIPVTFRLVNGAISGGAPLFDVSTINPAGLYYIARAYDTTGTLVFYGNYVITGAGSFNLGTAIPTSVTTSNISYSGVGFTGLNNIWTGNNTFQGTSTFTGISLFKSINAIQFADQFTGATADVKINACLAALPSGGTCDARGFGATSQTIAATIVVGDPGATFSHTLLLDRTTNFTCTITNNTSCIDLSPGSGLEWQGGSVTQPNVGITLSSSAAVSNVIRYHATAPAGHSGTYIRGAFLIGNPTATVSDSVVGLANILQPGLLENVYALNFTNTVELKIYSTGNSTVVNAPMILDSNFDCSGNTGCRPIWIGCAAQGSLTLIACGGVTQILFAGGGAFHPGTGGIPLVDIEGSNGAGGQNTVGDVTLETFQLESRNIADIGVLDAGAIGLRALGISASVNTNAGTDLFKFTQPAGTSTDGVSLVGIDNQGGWTNTVNDTITPFTMPYAGLLNTRVDFSYGASKNVVFGGKTRVTFVEGAAPTAVSGTEQLYGDSTAHALKSCYNGGTCLQVPQVIASGTATFTTTTVNTLTCQTTVTVAVAGIATTDAIEWAFSSATNGATDGMLITSAWVTSGNVNFQRCNPTAGNITPTALVANWRVIR